MNFFESNEPLHDPDMLFRIDGKCRSYQVDEVVNLIAGQLPKARLRICVID